MTRLNDNTVAALRGKARMRYKEAANWNMCVADMRSDIKANMTRSARRSALLDIVDKQICRTPKPMERGNRVCPTCGQPVLKGDRFCVRCGQRLMEVTFYD